MDLSFNQVIYFSLKILNLNISFNYYSMCMKLHYIGFMLVSTRAHLCSKRISLYADFHFCKKEESYIWDGTSKSSLSRKFIYLFIFTRKLHRTKKLKKRFVWKIRIIFLCCGFLSLLFFPYPQVKPPALRIRTNSILSMHKGT